ncbi:MAG: EpsI family protein, partial [Motiliproteus sp.]|nr:EpsI family protein [Motiliproteus sp.]
HLVYGWLFFGFIMAIMFWVGSFWQDPVENESFDTNQADTPNTEKSLKPLAWVSVFTIILFGASFIGLTNLTQKPSLVLNQPIEIELSEWSAIKSSSEWAPKFHGADSTFQQNFRARGGQEVALFIADYQFEDQGKELINSTNRLQRPDYWTVAEKNTTLIQVGSEKKEFNVLELRALNGSKRRILSWYNVIGQNETNAIKIKLIQAMGKLMGWGRGGTFYAIAIDYENQATAQQHLTQFIGDNWETITSDDIIVAKTPHMSQKDRGS